ncbi:hypothetical protein N0V95_004850 [Ascochyta clinopodiicola]|nr:hypothetical protein N0V95_004850 [Ascochyta clinopodiicola]
MGILFPPFQRLENANVLFPEGLHVPYYGNRAPEEASRAPEDSKTWYDDFQEDAAYNGVLDGIIGGEYNDKIGGLLLEKLTPGPMCMTVPNMTVPVTSSSPQEDRIVLSLYYRWALQILSAISFLHSHRIILNACGDLGSRWLRPDFSIALTGFVNAMIVPEGLDTLSFDEFSQEHRAEEPLEDTDYRCGEYSCYSEDGKDMIGVKSDLFQWATFVWRLMTGSEQAMVGWPWEPSSPKWDDPTADYGQNRDSLEYAVDQRHLEGLW